MGFQQGFRINTNTNTASLDTYRAYSKSQAGLEPNIERLSSGLRINSAKDDAAGLAISERMNNQVRGMQQANRNVQQGMNLLQTAEGAISEIGNILGRMRELAVQSASDTVNTSDRESLNLEFGQLKDEITRIARSTEYNGRKLLRGDHNGTENDPALTLQIGSNNDSNDQIEVEIGNFEVNSVWFGATSSVNSGIDDPNTVGNYVDASEVDFLDLSDLEYSQTSITNLDAMIGAVNMLDQKLKRCAKWGRFYYANWIQGWSNVCFKNHECAGLQPRSTASSGRGA